MLENAVLGSQMTPGVRPVITPLPPPQIDLSANQPSIVPFWKRFSAQPPRPPADDGSDQRAAQAPAAAAPGQQAPSPDQDVSGSQQPPGIPPSIAAAAQRGMSPPPDSAAPGRSVVSAGAASGPVQDAIVRAAQESGISPAYALAVAQRESDFNPNAKSSKSIYGMFQMSGNLRREHGSGDSDDPYVQAQGFAKFTKALKGEMAGVLGREPTDSETYLGHHFGGVRAARILSGGAPQSSVSDYFTPQEMAENPHFGKAGTIGNLVSSTLSDMNRRQSNFSGGNDGSPAANPEAYGTPVEAGAIDPMAYGTPVT